MKRGVAVLFGAIALAVLPVSAQAPKAKGKTDPAKVDLGPIEKKIFDLTNAARKKEGLAPLKYNMVLAKPAQSHSENQAKQRKMTHELDGKNVGDRVKAAGYQYGMVGENVAYGSGPIPAEQIFEGWMNSPGHRANILRKEYTEIGLGHGVAATGEVYYTQVFGRPLR